MARSFPHQNIWSRASIAKYIPVNYSPKYRCCGSRKPHAGQTLICILVSSGVVGDLDGLTGEIVYKGHNNVDFAESEPELAIHQTALEHKLKVDNGESKMARVSIPLVILVALAVVVVFSSPVAAYSRIIRGPTHHRPDILFNRRGWNGALCISDVASLLEEHEGRQQCAYDHENGYRAIGAGYNLDDDVDRRREELKRMGLDYDQVYRGESCVNDLQLAGLLIADAKRALDRAGENVKHFEDFCCSVQAVFADIQHSAGSADNFPHKDLEKVIEKIGMEQFKSAARALGKTRWCTREENTRRCEDNVDIVEKGCGRD